MANTFVLILVIATITTGLVWCLDKCIFAIKRYKNKNYKKIYAKNKSGLKTVKKNIRIQALLETGGSLFPVLAVVLVFRSFIYEPFQIPSGSMMPTLLINDFILVKKFAYGIKDPLYQKTLIKVGQPKRGDIVVFKYPKNTRLDYIKRAVGIPGDRVTYNPITKEVIIQPHYNSNRSGKDTIPITYSNAEPSDFMQTFILHKNGEISSDFFKIPKDKTKKNSIRLVERKETLNGIAHHILTVPIIQDQLNIYYHQPSQKLSTWCVPAGQYFMMGDNRDNSADSRYWGFVPEENLVGKAIAIWMSVEKQKGSWPIKIRLKRIGRIY